MKKIRGRTIGVFLVAALSGAALLHVSQNVQQVEEDLAAVEASYRSERETIRVLNAEWAYLNSPERLEALADEYLDLRAPAAGQMMPEAVGLPVSTIVDPALPAGAEGKSVLLRNVSQTGADGVVSGGVSSVTTEDPVPSIFVPAPGRKPKSQKGDFKALLKGLGKGGAQ